MSLSRLVKPLLIAAFALCLVVVVLGAYVRLNAAGLGCPDWPGCYGHVTPSGAVANDAGAAFGRTIEVGKAWREMIHRYAVGGLGVLVLALVAIVLRLGAASPVKPLRAIALLALLILQALLGMLTVTWQLNPLIVTLHLLFGLSTLSLIWWLLLTLQRSGASAWLQTRTQFAGSALHGQRRLATIALVALALQITLGGWTSSNYAATACPDLPKCQASWWPSGMRFGQAFAPWHARGVNYEGGVLDPEARVAIHFTHRLGALIVTLLLAYCAFSVLRARADDDAMRRAAIAVLVTLALQIVIGTTMVARGFPLAVATAHNAGAALLLLAVVALNRSLRPRYE